MSDFFLTNAGTHVMSHIPCAHILQSDRPLFIKHKFPHFVGPNINSDGQTNRLLIFQLQQKCWFCHKTDQSFPSSRPCLQGCMWTCTGLSSPTWSWRWGVGRPGLPHGPGPYRTSGLGSSQCSSPRYEGHDSGCCGSCFCLATHSGFAHSARGIQIVSISVP